MKNLYQTVLFLLSALLINVSTSFSQCTPVVTSTTPGLYPDAFPDATVNQYYHEVITFVFFKDTVVSGLKFDALNVKLNTINGLPIGMTWSSNKSNNNWDPQKETAGCVVMEGIPIAAGTYYIVASATITLGGIAGDQPYLDTLVLKVLPASSSNSSFAMSNPVGCGPLEVSFTNGTPGNNVYSWNFGDYTTPDTSQNPSHTYQNTGTYIVTQSVTPNAVPEYYLTDVTINTVPDNDFWENVFDIYFIIYDASNKVVYQGYDEKNNPSDESGLIRAAALPQKFTLPNIKLNAETYKIAVWDLDDLDGTLNLDADDDLGTTTFYGYGASGNAIGYAANGKGGALSLNYTIYATSVTTTITTDTVVVYPPVTSAGITYIGDTVFCDGNSIVLISSSATGNQWYENGAALIGYTAQTFTVSESGSYYTKITNSYGCTAEASSINITVYNNPPKPNFWNENGTLKNTLYGYDLQWYMNGNPIPGATTNTYTYTQTGVYSLVATNADGCTSESGSVTCTYVAPTASIEDVVSNLQNVNVYPNPSHGNVTLTFDLVSNENIELSISNILGQKLMSEMLYNAHGVISKSFNMENWPKGIYVLNLKEDNKAGVTRRIVLQ